MCTATRTREEFDRVAAPRVVQVPLGVDLHLFHPVRRSPSLRRALAPDGAPLLGMRPGCRAAAGLPVVFLGHVADRARLSQFTASVDLLVVPGPIETFGFAALEALASATPVVSRRRGALPELVDDVCGAPAYGHPGAFPTSALDLLDRGHGPRVAARAGPSDSPDGAIDRMLAVHGLPVAQRM